MSAGMHYKNRLTATHTGHKIILEFEIDNDISERDFQAAIIHTAVQAGWRIHHTWDSTRARRGFPDLVLARSDRLMFAELKSAKGRVRPEQQEWMEALWTAGQEAYIFRPKDWDEIVSILS